MKKHLMYLTLLAFALSYSANVEAQRGLLKTLGRMAGVSPKNVKNSAEEDEGETKSGTVHYTPFPPLGIDDSDISYYGPRTNMYKDNPRNKDATRFLEKAVKENNVENAEKLLKAGASAYISYEMIYNKQYEMIDVMYKNNPNLIRFSQLLHYACAKSDSTMIDFLVERGASFDLNGYYLKYGNTSTPGKKGYNVATRWNNDVNYKYTPADVAFYYNRNNLHHIMNKYHKYPTIYGVTRDLYMHLRLKSGVKSAYKIINNDDSLYKEIFENVDYTITDVLNLGYNYVTKDGDDLHQYLYLNEVVGMIGESRKAKDNRDEELIDLLNLMIDKGADVNCEVNNTERAMSYAPGFRPSGWVNTTPMYVALRYSNMLDIVKLLRSKGASMEVTSDFRKVSVTKLNILDEYKEFFMLEGIE